MYFYVRLNAPRTTFLTDMTDNERAVMDAHIANWTRLTQERTAVLFGPVFDPAGGFGVGILDVADEQAAKDIVAQDPTATSNLGFTFDIYPMMMGMIRNN